MHCLCDILNVWFGFTFEKQAQFMFTAGSLSMSLSIQHMYIHIYFFIDLHYIFFCESMKGYSFRRGVLSKNPGEMSLLCYFVLEGLFG